MAKEELLEFEGEVTEELPDGNFRVKLDNEHVILAYTAGKMRKFRIRTGVGDRVTVEMSPYDLARGRITFRHKSAQPTTAATGTASQPRPGARAPQQPNGRNGNGHGRPAKQGQRRDGGRNERGGQRNGQKRNHERNDQHQSRNGNGRHQAPPAHAGQGPRPIASTQPVSSDFAKVSFMQPR